MAKKHAELGPSGAERWMACPGSVILSRGLPNPTNSYSDEGTCAHFLAAHCLDEGTNATDYEGRELAICSDGKECFSEDKGDSKIRYRLTADDDFCASVQQYIGYVREVVASTGGVLHVEQRLSIAHITGEEDAEGTSDVVIVTPDELIVIDLKFGMGVKKDAEGNPQLKLYGLASMDKYGLVNDFNDVRVVIHQPRLYHVSEHVYSIEEMEDFRLQVELAASQVDLSVEEVGAEDWHKTYTKAGEDQCRWCLAQATCPTAAAKVKDAMDAEFDDLSEEVVNNAKFLDPEVLSRNLKAVDFIEAWCKSVRAGVESALLAGRAVPDFKLVQGKKGHRSWTDTDAVEAAFKSMRLKVDEMYDLKLISPTTAEKVLKDSPKRWSKIGQFITQKEGGPSVAPASDKRPALDLTVAMEDLSEPVNDTESLI